MKGKENVAALSRLARESARASAVKSKHLIHGFAKNAMGVPMPSNGIFWSVSHKPEFVGGIVSTEKIGIDLERLKDVSEALFQKIVDSDEARHFGHQDKTLIFFRAFTAKEAVLKKTTDGIKGLSKAKIKRVMDDRHLVVQYLNKKYWVENFYFDGYLASVTKDHFDLEWTVG
ncbi:MAG: 4'-phosphopantetheinyl transferase superfamily protein [Desulfobacula sp.]|nr:4'-phosphopantetheinyl transferase superfamily protein [Desulfobacula sp.]